MNYIEIYKEAIYKEAEFRAECKDKEKASKLKEEDRKKIKEMLYKKASAKESLKEELTPRGIANFIVGNRKFNEDQLDGSSADLLNPMDRITANKIGDVATGITLGTMAAFDKDLQQGASNTIKDNIDNLKNRDFKKIVETVTKPVTDAKDFVYSGIKNRDLDKKVLQKGKSIVTNPKVLTTMVVSQAMPSLVDYARGKNLARVNDTEFTAKDWLRTNLPFTSPDVVIKDKLRKQKEQ